jgi:outer membrane lipoprotein
MLRQIRKLNLVIIAIAILGGCASKPPAAISKIPPENPSLTRVRMDVDSFIGTEVRWGGVIGKVENRATHTWIELVRQKLRDDGKPRADDRSDGRFIASFEGFVDPVVYEVGRPLTVVGTIEAKTERPIGEYDYLFPIVAVEGSYLWKAATKYRDPYYPPPYWYYDLRFYHPWPYHRHPRYH